MKWTPVQNLQRDGIDLHLVFASSDDETGSKKAIYESECGQFWAKHIIEKGDIWMSSNIPF